MPPLDRDLYVIVVSNRFEPPSSLRRVGMLSNLYGRCVLEQSPYIREGFSRYLELKADVTEAYRDEIRLELS